MKRSASDTALPDGLQKMQRVDLTEDIPEFVGLKGQLLVDAIFNKYGQGRAWMVAASTTSTLPAQAITYNHRSEAMYRAIAKEPSNPYVLKSLSTGLENVRILSSKTPIKIREVPTRNAGSGERLLPQVFTKPGGETLSIMSYLTTPMATSAVFKKLEEEHNVDAPTHDVGGDRGKDKDKSLPSIKRRGGAGGRGQGAGGRGRGRKGRKAAEKEGGEAANCDVEDADVEKESESWSAMAYPLMSEGLSDSGSRHKTALDDFMHQFLHISTGFENKLASTEKACDQYKSAVMTLFGHAMSCFYEFCFTGSVAINGKFVKAYTAFRDEMSTFISTGCELASGKKALSLATHISDMIDGETAGLSLSYGKDEPDEIKTTNRIKIALPIVIKTGMETFLHEAKQALAMDAGITGTSSLFSVLQKIYDALRDALPQEWISLAVDVSEMLSVRLGFVGGSHELFRGQRGILERFITIRSLYALTLLRSLAQLKKTSFDIHVNLLVTSLQVDMDNSLKLSLVKESGGSGGTDAGVPGVPKPHKVASLVPGFDALQSN
eukprot:s722_g6.t1